MKTGVRKFLKFIVDLFSMLFIFYSSDQQMNASLQNNLNTPALPAEEILQAIQGIRFGVVEVVVHDSRVTEIRQTRRLRLPVVDTEKNSSHPTTGG